MAADPLDRVLQLVAEGRLTADEAAPILAALDERATPGAGEGAAGGAGPEAGRGTTADAASDAGGADGHGFDAPSSGPTSLRLEVREAGRQVVNLRLPLAMGRFALDRIPGLSGDQVERVRDALRDGMRGPILLVEDGDNVVRIVLE
jgi:hypothetical protein